MKRAFDLALATGGLVGLSPLLLAIAVLVRLDSPGRAIFRQERIGLHGRTFQILKFRSMRAESPSRLVTTSRDPRITRAGRILRSTKLDEVPQLWNIVRGEMSFVGPRPEVERFAKLWTPEQWSTILSIRPGLTDPTSLLFRREEHELAKQPDPERYYIEEILPRKAEMYVHYAQNHSFMGDLGVLARTARAVVTG